ncbi:MAG: RHS repeat-associated core domain-containing protein [Shewanella sp.]
MFIKDNDGNYQSDRHFSATLTIDKNKQFVLTYADGYQRIYGVPKGTKALQNFLLQERDSAGNTLTFGYDAQARMIHVVDASGRQTTLNYNAQGLIETVTDPFGRSASFEYDDKRNLIALTDMQGYRASLTYDENKLITSLTDAKGTTAFYIEPSDGIRNGSDAYNPPGTPMWENYRITVTLPTGGKQEYYYDGYHKKAWYVSADHYQAYSASLNNSSRQVPKTIYEFVTPNGRKGEIAKVTYPDGSSTQYSYYANNKIKSQKNQWGQLTQYQWNKKGNITQIISPLGLETLYTYADNGVDLLSVYTVNGETQYQYDGHHNVTRITDIEGNHRILGYDNHQNLISVTDVNGVVTEFIRNANGLIDTVKIDGSVVNTYSHDTIGRLTSVKDINGYQHYFQYDNLNTLTQITDPAGRTTTRVFGDCPRLLDKKTLPGDRTYQYEYDKYKRLTKIIDPMRGRIELGRSPSGRITSLIDQNSNQTRFDYTSTGQMSKKTYADGQSLGYRYDKGRISQITNARGIVKTYHYNDKQQLSGIRYSDNTPSVNYQYDSQGRLRGVTDQWGSTLYSYDNDSRIKEIDGPLDNDTIRFIYNKQGAIASLSISGKQNAAYTYDNLGRIATITALGQLFRYQYTYTPTSPSVRLTYPNSISQGFIYGQKGDLTQLQYQQGETTLADYRYQFDSAGQLAKQTGTPAWGLPENDVVARYNDLNQIIEWNGDQAAFVYDKDGNPTQGMLKDNMPFTAKYDAENRLTELMFTRDGVQYKEVFGYAHNHMLVQYQGYKENVLVNTKRFVRLGLVELQQRNAQDGVEQEYSWNLYAAGGIGGLLTTKIANRHHYYLYSHMGSVQKVLNDQGQVVADYRYTPYGEVQGDSFTQQPFGYSTKRSDFESGLVYFGYRFYSPNLKRWLNRDPLQEQGGINLYAYINGDPLGYIDPDGRSSGALGAGIGSFAGPPGTVVGGLVGFAGGIAFCLFTDLCHLNDNAAEPDAITNDLIDDKTPDPYDYPTDGGQEQCDADFDKYPGNEVETSDPKRRRKQLPDGRWINTHPSSTRPGNPPTLEVPKPGNKKKKVKIRYE